jgi:hypothetical protein
METRGIVLAQPNVEPVKLTPKQIEGILREIPPPPGIGKSALDIAQKHMRDRVYAQLEKVKLVPIQAAYEEYKDLIIQSIYESYIEPGTSVGITAGVSLGGPVTQLSLNSFHFAGAQSGVALAFQKIRDFLTGSKMNRSPQMKIYFKVPYVGSDLHEVLHVGNFDSILAKRPELEQTLVSDVVLDSRILTHDEAESAGIPSMISLHSLIRRDRFIDSNVKFPLSYVVELKLNTYRMFTHKITMAMVARAIEGPHSDKHITDALTCVWKSQIDGRMYILVDENKDYALEAINRDVSILMFLTRYVVRQYDQWKISGISDIISIEPQEVNVVEGIYRIQASENKPGTHYVYTNNRKTRWDGVSLMDIHRLIKAAGFTVQPITNVNKEKLFLIVTDYVGDLDKELNRRIRSAQNKAANKRTPEENGIVNAASFHYALTNGTNMEEIVWRDDIDLFRTASNHSHEILKMLGIDAARIFLIFRFMQTLQDFSSYINPRHISLIFDLLCNLGIINSLSFVGINRRRIGPLAMASYERSLDVFVNSSTFGDREAPIGVSPAIYLGQPGKRMGTASISIEDDLTVIPRDRPTAEATDEIIDWNDIGNIFEGPSLSDIIGGGERPIIPGNIDRIRTPKSTRITNQPQATPQSIVPSSTNIMIPTQTLINALQKVTIGTDLNIQPQEIIPDITTVENITGLTLIRNPLPQQPAGILSSLQNISKQNITLPIPAPKQNIALPQQNITLPIPAPKQNIALPQQNITLPIPQQSVGILSSLQNRTVSLPAQTANINSFIDTLPDISSTTTTIPQQTAAPNISISGFLNQLQNK